MTDCLADTNIVSDLFKGHSFGKLYLPFLQGKRLVVSFMTVAELYEGADRAQWGEERRHRLEDTLRRYLVIPSSLSLCREWGRVRYERRHQPVSGADGWIAATARLFGLPLVTHNPGDFAAISNSQVVTKHKS